jgi:hypothetical protein
MEGDAKVLADFERYFYRPVSGQSLDCDDKRQP